MNEKKICFILCVNDEMYEEECLRYIGLLHVPQGYEVEQLSVKGAPSMTAGYQFGMQQSDAKYKVYLHQDVFISNPDFLAELLQVFTDERVGMFGMVGAPKLPPNGVMWAEGRVGMIYSSNIRESGLAVIGPVKQPYTEVEAIDGLLMATQYDLPWREDLFLGWDFYDVSQSMEFRRKEYKVVVPYMEHAWCMHDDGYVNLEKYFEWQEVFLQEYGDMIHAEDY